MANTTIASTDKKTTRQPVKVDYGKILTYLILTLGAFIAIVPFLWMLSASLMNLTEATGRAVLPLSLIHI